MRWHGIIARLLSREKHSSRVGTGQVSILRPWIQRVELTRAQRGAEKVQRGPARGFILSNDDGHHRHADGGQGGQGVRSAWTFLLFPRPRLRLASLRLASLRLTSLQRLLLRCVFLRQLLRLLLVLLLQFLVSGVRLLLMFRVLLLLKILPILGLFGDQLVLLLFVLLVRLRIP